MKISLTKAMFHESFLIFHESAIPLEIVIVETKTHLKNYKNADESFELQELVD